MADLTLTAADLKLVSGLTATAKAGTTVTAGQVVYLDSSTGKLLLADANVTAAAADAIGVALHAALLDQPLKYALAGAVLEMGSTTAPAAGKMYIVSDTAGAWSPHSDATTPATGEFCTVIALGIGNNRVKLVLVASGVAAA